MVSSLLNQFSLQRSSSSVFTAARMSDRAEALRQRIRESGKSVRRIAQEAGVTPLKLWRWVTGRTMVLDMTDADKVEKVLTKEESP